MLLHYSFLVVYYYIFRDRDHDRVWQFSAPTAANLGTVATFQGHGQAEVSQVAMVQYLSAIPAITMLMIYFLSLDL